VQLSPNERREDNLIELYHFWSSVCSVRCRMALEEKRVKWTSRYIDLFKFDQMRPEYLKLNPDGVVPTLVHDGKPIRESTIINEYIDAAVEGPKLVPADPLKAARMREFTGYVDCIARAKLTGSRFKGGESSQPPFRQLAMCNPFF
jgi:glutathione S-transferase